MEGRPIEYIFPLKGIHATGLRQQQPDLTTAPEAMGNMVPYDRLGRARGAQRVGTAKVQAAGIGAPSGVFGLAATALNPDPATAAPSISLFLQDFSQLAQNATVGTIGGSSQATYYCVNTSSTPMPIGAQKDNALTIGGATAPRTAGVGPSNSQAFCSAQLVTPQAIGSSYSLKMVAIPVSGVGSGAPFSVGMMVRMNAIASPNNAIGYYLECWTDKVQVVDASTSTIICSATISISGTGGNFTTIELRVQGNTFTVFINGAQVCTGTGANFTSNTGVGFYAGNVVSYSQGIQSFQVLAAGAVARTPRLVAAAGGALYAGDIITSSLTNLGSALVTDGVRVGIAFGQGFAYVVDGTVIKKIDLSGLTVANLVATAGSLPTNCTLAVVWRDRLILAAPRGTPQNFYCSRVGTHTDWDYSQTDPAAAFAGNASTAGHIGDPITALMPYNDDVMILGGDHHLWAIKGDPADGGSIDLISDNIGVLQPSAWCKSPDGTIYFVGTGGLYKLDGTKPVEIAGSRYNEFFRTLDRAANFITLAWDRDRQGMYIFVTPTVAGNATHLWYDARQDGFFPLAWPVNHGPVTACWYDADAPVNRFVILGGRTGFLQKIVDTATDDDGTAISSFVAVGPSKPGGQIGPYGNALPGSDLQEGTLTALDVILGEIPTTFVAATNWNCAIGLYSGHDANIALNTLTGGSQAAKATRTFTLPGRQRRWMPRVRGVDLWLRLSNSVQGKFFSFDRATAWVLPTGRERR